MTRYHVSVLYNTSIRMGRLNYVAQFDKCGLKGCTKYALIKLQQYLYGIQYSDEMGLGHCDYNRG